MTDNGENYDDGDFSDDERWKLAELQTLIEIIDRQQEGLDRLAHNDPVGLVWFGDRDDWVEKRLNTRQ